LWGGLRRPRRRHRRRRHHHRPDGGQDAAPHPAARDRLPGDRPSFGSRAKQAASELAFGKQVTIRPIDTDRYGRTVAEVILPDGRLMNREMVRRGMAWWYRAVRRITA
jgi:endonuclease YncB( thermonuclease family)